MTGFDITQGERARWQRQAAAELGQILRAHPGLPCISWTVGPSGAVLVGQVSGLAPAAQVREAFTAWRLALALEEHPAQLLSGGAAVRRGCTRRRAASWCRSGSPRRPSAMRSSREPS